MKKSNILMIALAISSFNATFSVDSADSQLPEHRIADPGPTTKVEDFLDYIMLEGLGYDKVSPETEQFIRNVQKELGMEDLPIYLRKMSRRAMRMVGRENAFAMSPFSLTNRVYVSEDWFNELSEEEKLFLIRHELGHLKKRHLLKRSGVSLALSLGGGYIIYKFVRCLIGRAVKDHVANLDSNHRWEKWIKDRSGNLILGASIWATLILSEIIPVKSLVSSYFSRCCEHESDTIGAQDLQGARGGVAFFKRLQDCRDPQSRFENKRRSAEREKALNKWFMSHPSLEKRLEYCQKRIKELDVQELSPAV